MNAGITAVKMRGSSSRSLHVPEEADKAITVHARATRLLRGCGLILGPEGAEFLSGFAEPVSPDKECIYGKKGFRKESHHHVDLYGGSRA
ncbi:MAG: hypothetical protein IKO11_08940, partial [Lachnospiraceae bacterium]|nr:hypothetical protein [Lachnospiraceae bacterium]